MKNIKIIGKLLLVGSLTAIVRIIAQLLIPSGNQDILKPSIFVENGTMPVAFTIYGIFAYAVIAAMFLIVKNQLNGNRIIKGLKYAIACCLIWIVYLLEPLPHVALIDKFTYPLADSCALLVLGVLSGLLLCENKINENNRKLKLRLIPTITISVCFVIGRVIQYSIINIYSSYTDNKVATIAWCVITGIVISIVLQWLNNKTAIANRFVRIILVGAVLFGADLLLFNFFMPLVFDADIPDLIVRTCIDFGSATIGCLSLTQNNDKSYTI